MSSAFRRRRSFSQPFTAVLCASLFLASPAVMFAPPAFAASEVATQDESDPSEPQLVPFQEDVSTTSNASYDAGRYVVVLNDSPAALNDGSVAGLRASDGEWDGTSDEKGAVAAYGDYLRTKQNEVAESAGAQPVQQLTSTTNAFVADLDATQAAALAADPRVKTVVRNEVLPLAEYEPSTDLLGMSGENGVWSGLGGPENVGDGVVVGVVDTGIAPENPSFAGAPLGSTSGSEPYLDGDTVVYDKSDGGTFHGICQSGDQFDISDCSTKVIGARYFIDGFGESLIGNADVGEYLSPRDGEGHGSHTASTAAGNYGVDAGGVTVSGMSPSAKIAMYKACWSGPDPESADDDGCSTVDLLAAIEAATEDGVDVINYSVGGSPATTTNSVVDQAFMAAASTGIFVAAAAGNSGPDASTLDNASPWITTVAASTIPAPAGTVELGDGQKFSGATITVTEPLSAPVVLGDAVALQGREADALRCAPDTLDPALVAGRIVVCDRGVEARTLKSAEVLRAGGVGMILVNPTPSSTDVDEHSVPTVHIDSSARDAVRAYATTTGATVTLTEGADPSLPAVAWPQVAGFSSRGPALADSMDLIKPDIAAPGTTILAAHGNPKDGTPTFGYSSGTSMASPHVAGLAAVYLSEHPAATPAEIKSAIMTTASDTVDDAGAPAQDPFAQGNGEIEPGGMLDAGLLYLNGLSDWQSYLKSIGQGPSSAADIDASDLNLASIAIGSLAGTQTVTRTVTSTSAGSYTADVSGVPGVDVVVEPSTMSFDGAGEQHTFTVTFTRTTAELGTFSTGYLQWRNDADPDKTIRSALAVNPTDFGAAEVVDGVGETGQVAIDAHFGTDASLDLATVGLARGSRVNGEGTVGSTARYAITVPDGIDLLRFDLSSIDRHADIDLTVFYRTDDGNMAPVDQSATPSVDETLEFEAPFAGTYVAQVSFYTAGLTPEIPYSLAAYSLDVENPVAAFQVAPSPLQGSTGETKQVTASWSDLQGGTYLGIVGYGDTGIATSIRIDAGAPEVPPGSPQITVSPGADEWLLDGADLRVTGTGLTPGADYSVNIDGGDPERVESADEDGAIDWLVPTTASSTQNRQVHITGPGVDETRTFKTSPVTFAGGTWFSRPTFAGAPAVTLEAWASGTGTILFEISDASGAVVTSSTVATVPQLFTTRSPEMQLPSGEYTATATAMRADGTRGASYAFDPISVTSVTPGSITAGEVDPAGNVLVTIDDALQLPERATVTYYLCDGRRIAASEEISVGTSTDTWRLAGTTAVVVTDRLGQEIWSSDGVARCDAEFGDPLGQDLWQTASAADPTADGYDPDRPIDIEVAYRYEPLIDLYGLEVAENGRTTAPFLRQPVTVENVSVRGPVSRTPVTVREGVPTYAYVSFMVFQNGNEVTSSDSITMPALKASELVPGTTPAVAGSITIRGEVRVGVEASAEVAGWTPDDLTYTYQWLLDGIPIGGANDVNYTPSPEDAGHALSVAATGTSPSGATASAQSVSQIVSAAPQGPDTNPGENNLANTGVDGGSMLSWVIAGILLAVMGASIVLYHRLRARRQTSANGL